MIEIQNASGHPVGTGPLKAVLTEMLKQAGKPSHRIEVMIMGNEGLRTLNSQFRGVDEATDVLTFPSPLPEVSLGDIAISLDFARAQAKLRGVRIREELAMLGIHGGLHLLGYDDQTRKKRAIMLSRMNDLMAAVGLPTEPNWASLPHPLPSEYLTTPSCHDENP